MCDMLQIIGTIYTYIHMVYMFYIYICKIVHRTMTAPLSTKQHKDNSS